MPASAWLKIPVADRRDATLTIERSGELYGCQLTLFVKFVGAGDSELIPDKDGNTATDFMISPNVRSISGAKLRSGDDVYLDAIVTIAQPAKLTGKIDFVATLTIPGQDPSKTNQTVELKPGDTGALADLGWEIDKP